MIGILHLGSVALYGIASTMLGVSLARDEARRLPAIATLIVAAGLLVHAAALADYTSRWEQLPLAGLGPSLSTLAFLIGVGSVIAATLGHASTVGLILIPVVTALTGIAAIVGIAPTGQSLDWFVLHVVFAFIGLVGLTVAFAAGLMYLIQFRELKSKHFGAVFRFFPPLETLDRLGRRGLLVGFPFLTLSLVLGWIWTRDTGGFIGPDPSKLTWVAVSWFVFLAAIVSRSGAGRRGERGAIVSVVGFIVVVAVYLIMRAQATRQGIFL